MSPKNAIPEFYTQLIIIVEVKNVIIKTTRGLSILVIVSLSASPMLCQLSYEVKSVRVCDISELSLVPLILLCFMKHHIYIMKFTA